MRIQYYTLYLCGLIVGVFFVLQQLLGWDLAWEVGSISQNFFLSMVAHANTSHLLGNLFGLFLFGLLLEGTIGSKRFLYLVVATGVAGNLAGIGSYNRVLGISGVVLGVIGALTVLRPKMLIWAFGFPMPMLLAGAIYAAIDLLGVLAPASNTGHLAHLGGLVVGGVLGWYWRDEARTFGEGFFESKKRRASSRKLSKQERRRLDKELDRYEDRYLR